MAVRDEWFVLVGWPVSLRAASEELGRFRKLPTAVRNARQHLHERHEIDFVSIYAVEGKARPNVRDEPIARVR